jgi:hypothetical protein
MARSAHYRRCGQRRNGGLADRDHVRSGTDEFEVLDDIVDVVVKVEAAFAQGDHLGVGPVGDVHLAAFQHAFHRSAQ